MKQKTPIVALILLGAACDMSPKSGFGFSLPEGDPDAGETVFVAQGCLSCHSVAGLEAEREAIEPELNISIGGETTRIATYGELVTSVINPSHRLAKGYDTELIAVDGVSKMKNYNDVLTVAELTDLVSFLQSKYKLKDYPETRYPPYVH